MAAAYVRALATVLLMGRVAVLYRYCAVLVTLFCTRGRRPASPAALCTRGRRPARSPPTPRAFGSARRLEARPGPAAALGHHSCPHVEGVPCHPPSGTAAACMSKGCPATRPRAPQLPAYRRGALPPALEYRSRPHAEGVPCHPPRPRSRPCARAGSRPGYARTKSPGPNGPGDSPSGWRDLNPRPLRPERSALPSCATPRCPMSIAIPRRKTQTEIGGQWEVCATPQR